MAIITRHSKKRIVERVNEIDTFLEAKRVAKQARRSGKTINKFQNYPKFFSYLQSKRGQTNTASIRVYKDFIYIWRGDSHKLMTVIPIPNRFVEEMANIDN